MLSRTMRYPLICLILIIPALIICLAIVGGCTRQEADPIEETFAQLDKVRDRKISDIQHHLTGLENTADGIGNDTVMLDAFRNLLASAKRSSELVTPSLTASQAQELNAHYVHQYGNFYDILFVEQGGFVFYSIKQESDHGANLFSGRLADTRLARSLRADPTPKFIDFERYNPSGEAAAFFVVPVVHDGKPAGWFVLQYGSNTLNALLADRGDLARTGEVYLVNNDNLMLSDSRFVNDTTVLAQVVETDAVKSAFTTGIGHAVTRDYRGVRVLSSYAPFGFLATTWALLVEIDEDEVISTHYARHSGQLLGDLVRSATGVGQVRSARSVVHRPLDRNYRVDMGEARRVDQGQTCWTPGVGPCTAVVAYYPGRFGYLAHLGPTDDVYVDNALSREILGAHRTRFLHELTMRIKHFDVVPSELSSMRFVVIATHANSIKGILETLLEQGFDLAQIRFLLNPEADFANVRFDQAGDGVEVEWVRYREPESVTYTDAAGRSNLATLLKRELPFFEIPSR